MTRLDHEQRHGSRPRRERAHRHKAKRREERAPRTADWLVLAYLAGDNDLESALLGDLKEMERVGSRPGQVEILAQMDRAAGFDASKGDWRTTRRYYVRHGRDPRRLASRLLADLGETNTGDPRVLEEFIRFGAREYPARACALILSNHGSGFYVPPPMLSSLPGADRVIRSTRVRRRGFFSMARGHVHAGAMVVRGIAYDDEAADCLDNRELKAVVRQARRVLGRKLDLVGMDACLMTMLEVAYQLREHVRVLVGSEEDEPNEGWPYQAILGDLTARPTMSATALGAAIVRRYTEFYRRRDVEATQSAIDLGRLDDLVGAVDTLARALLAALASRDVLLAVHAARRCSVTFLNGAYVDLHDFARNLAAGTPVEAVRRAAEDVMTIIEGRGASSPIIAAGSVGPRLEPTRGLSIYFPLFRDPSAFYRELDFAQRTQWAAFLDAYLRRRRAGEA